MLLITAEHEIADASAGSLSPSSSFSEPRSGMKSRVGQFMIGLFSHSTRRPNIFQLIRTFQLEGWLRGLIKEDWSRGMMKERECKHSIRIFFLLCSISNSQFQPYTRGRVAVFTAVRSRHSQHPSKRPAQRAMAVMLSQRLKWIIVIPTRIWAKNSFLNLLK